MMNNFVWEKRGKIFSPDISKYDLVKSHSQIPTILVLDKKLRVFFSTRPELGKSLTTFVDLDIEDPSKILYEHSSPILELGLPGEFDEHGIMPQCVFKKGNIVYLYYLGWSKRTNIRYSNWTGLAKSFDDGKTFEKHANVPVMDRCVGNAFSITGLFTLEQNKKLYGFYASGTGWQDVNGKLEETYTIKRASSSDGICWEFESEQLLQKSHPLEVHTRPTLIKLNNFYHMWFCYRKIKDFRGGKNSYRIGYAYSKDLKNWFRDDTNAGIGVSEHGWDSNMIAYPYIVKTKREILMFYNGNGFGQSGFGYAKLKVY